MTDKTMWMVRAGESALRFEEFERQQLVSIGWPEMGNLNALSAREDFVRQALCAYLRPAARIVARTSLLRQMAWDSRIRASLLK